MIAFAIDFKAGTVRKFSSTRLANAVATETEDTFTNQENMTELGAKIADFVTVYNSLTGKSITKFSDRPTAVARVWEAIVAADLPVTEVETTETAEEVEPEVKRGRPSGYAGMSLTASKEAQAENPRREGSHGFRSMEIIRNNPGISAEDYFAAGGRPNDLRWDVDHGHVFLT